MAAKRPLRPLERVARGPGSGRSLGDYEFEEVIWVPAISLTADGLEEHKDRCSR
jgi:hypothetical protein